MLSNGYLVGFQSISQKNLAEHIRKFHDETSEKNVYECDQCFYRSASIQVCHLTWLTLSLPPENSLECMKHGPTNDRGLASLASLVSSIGQ